MRSSVQLRGGAKVATPRSERGNLGSSPSPAAVLMSLTASERTVLARVSRDALGNRL